MKNDDAAKTGQKVTDVFQGEGEVLSLLRARDWSKTELGSPETWSESFKVSLSICMASKVPFGLYHQLKKFGVESECFSDGEAALASIQAQSGTKTRFDVAVIDMQMPKMSGIMLAQAVSEDRSIAGLPMIMLTSIGQMKSQDLEKVGIGACLAKPA